MNCTREKLAACAAVLAIWGFALGSEVGDGMTMSSAIYQTLAAFSGIAAKDPVNPGLMGIARFIGYTDAFVVGLTIVNHRRALENIAETKKDWQRLDRTEKIAYLHLKSLAGLFFVACAAAWVFGGLTPIVSIGELQLSKAGFASLSVYAFVGQFSIYIMQSIQYVLRALHALHDLKQEPWSAFFNRYTSAALILLVLGSGMRGLSYAYNAHEVVKNFGGSADLQKWLGRFALVSTCVMNAITVGFPSMEAAIDLHRINEGRDKLDGSRATRMEVENAAQWQQKKWLSFVFSSLAPSLPETFSRAECFSLGLILFSVLSRTLANGTFLVVFSGDDNNASDNGIRAVGLMIGILANLQMATWMVRPVADGLQYLGLCKSDLAVRGVDLQRTERLLGSTV